MCVCVCVGGVCVFGVCVCVCVFVCVCVCVYVCVVCVSVCVCVWCVCVVCMCVCVVRKYLRLLHISAREGERPSLNKQQDKSEMAKTNKSKGKNRNTRVVFELVHDGPWPRRVQAAP